MVKRQIVKNISFSFCANLLSFIVSIFMVMFVPKFLSIDEHGKWQLFLFYMTYLGGVRLDGEMGFICVLQEISWRT